MANALKKAAIYLGLAEGEIAEPKGATETAAQAETQQVAVASEKPTQAVVTPLKRSVPTRAAVQQPLSEILTVHPASYSEAPQIAEHFRDGVPVILNLARLSDTDARRIIDFAGGLVLGLNGHIERVTGKVFLLTPEHIAIADVAEPEQNETGSFFVAPQR